RADVHRVRGGEVVRVLVVELGRACEAGNVEGRGGCQSKRSLQNATTRGLDHDVLPGRSKAARSIRAAVASVMGYAARFASVFLTASAICASSGMNAFSSGRLKGTGR